MFDKHLYKTKDSRFFIQFFIKEDNVVDMNVYKDSGSIIFSYSPIYQSLFKDLNIPVAKTIMTKVKNGKTNKDIEEVEFNPLLKDNPYPLSKIKDNLLLEHLVGQEKEEFVKKVEQISTSRNESLTRMGDTTPINSSYLLQGHCFFIEEKKEQLFLSRTEVQPNTILVRQIGKPSNGTKTFLKHTESIIPFIYESVPFDTYKIMSEIETGQLFGLYKQEGILALIPYDKLLFADKEKIKLFNLNGEIVVNDSLLNIIFEEISKKGMEKTFNLSK